eukprot:SAG11_NODE_3607_length_2343_cov_2.335561_2_plen_57_part_00
MGRLEKIPTYRKIHIICQVLTEYLPVTGRYIDDFLSLSRDLGLIYGRKVQLRTGMY